LLAIGALASTVCVVESTWGEMKLMRLLSDHIPGLINNLYRQVGLS